MTRSEKVSVSHKQFSQLVQESDASVEDSTGYLFSNMRRFDTGAGASGYASEGGYVDGDGNAYVDQDGNPY